MVGGSRFLKTEAVTKLLNFAVECKRIKDYDAEDECSKRSQGSHWENTGCHCQMMPLTCNTCSATLSQKSVFNSPTAKGHHWRWTKQHLATCQCSWESTGCLADWCHTLPSCGHCDWWGHTAPWN